MKTDESGERAWEVGDVVVTLNGGSKMTVEAIGDDDAGDAILCVWHSIAHGMQRMTVQAYCLCLPHEAKP